MGEHLEPVVACDADEREARHLCNADGQSRRRRHPDDDGRPHHGGFLHELDGNPARQHDDAVGSRPAGVQQCARQFVERIVPPYVFAQNQALIRPPERGGVNRSRLHVQLLSRRQRGHCLCDVLPAHLQVITRHRDCAIGFGQTLQSAHAASGRSNKPAAPCRERIGPVAGQPHSQHDPVSNTDYGQFRYFSRCSNNSLGVAETERKILEIVGCRHQDGVRRTVIAECDRHLLGQGAFAEQRGAIAPCLPRDAPRRRRHDARSLQRRHFHLPEASCGGCGRTKTGIDFAAGVPLFRS